MKQIILAAASLALLGAQLAPPDEFEDCDGFKAPTATSDGTENWRGLYILPDPELRQIAENAALASCDKALVHPLLKPHFAARHALLIRGKAEHQLALGRNREALATLDQSDAVVAQLSDPRLAAVLTTGNRLLRAYADYANGDADAARALLAGIEKDHLYSMRVMETSRGLRLAFDPDPGQVRRAMLKRVPTDPAMLSTLFWLAFAYGDFGEVLRLGPQVSFELPRGRSDSNISGVKTHQYDVIELRANHAGAMAYGLAALGQAEAARGAMAKARRDAAEASRLPAAPPRDARERSDHHLRYYAGQLAAAKLDHWDRAIALRGQAPTMTAEEFTRAMDAKELRGLPISIDLLGQFKPKSLAEEAALRRTIKTLEERRDSGFRKLDTLNLSALIQALPRPGSDWTPRFRAAGDGLIFGDSNGFYMKQEPRSPYLNIRYGDTAAPKWAIEELTLLAAATYVRKAGKDSFLIDSRMMVDREIRIVGWRGETQGAQSNGAELRYRILPVNAAQLPPELESRRWRLIGVQEVMNALNPIYQPASPRKKR